MSIESFVDKSRIDIRGVNTERPKPLPELPFDPDKESARDWPEILEWLETQLAGNNAPSSMRVFRQTAILGLDRKEDFTIVPIESISFLMASYRANNNWPAFMNTIFFYKIAYSEGIPKAEFNYGDFQKVYAKIAGFKAGLSWYALANFLTAILMAFPERRPDLELDEDLFRSFNSCLEFQRKKNNWQDFLTFLAAIKIAFPERFSEILVSSEEWRRIETRCQQLRIPDRQISLADCKIILAEEIYSTPTSFELVMPKPKQDFNQTLPMPEEREF